MQTKDLSNIRPLTEFRNKMQDEIEFINKVVQGLKDYKNNRVHSVEDTFDALNKIIIDDANS